MDVVHIQLVPGQTQELPGLPIEHELGTRFSSCPQHLALLARSGGIVPLELGHDRCFTKTSLSTSMRLVVSQKIRTLSTRSSVTS